jgi:hypothetical protein
MHDLLTSALAGNLPGMSKQQQMPEQLRAPRLSDMLRGVAALVAFAMVATMIGFAESSGTEMAGLAIF